MCYNKLVKSLKEGFVMSIAKYIFPLIDGLIIAFMTIIIFGSHISFSYKTFLGMIIIISATILMTLLFKKFYSTEKFCLKDLYKLFEGLAIAAALLSLIACLMNFSPLTYFLLTAEIIGIFIGIAAIRIGYIIGSKLFKRTKNVLIVGAGQGGKLIAEEIQQRPELGLNVVGFLDDNMNSIEDEDSTIPILGLTCDSEAVIKDNNVKIVIIAVKSRMDSDILTDIIKGVPLGVKVWRMPKFYEKITRKYLVSKMTVNWLFYSGVRKQALLYSYLKRFCDIAASIAIMLITLPISLIAAIGIKLSDWGPVFFTQMRIGKYGKPFKMIKFRSMYQDEVEDNFDDDLNEIEENDKRIMPFCKILRKFHIDELPQMLNVLKGDMSIVGPRMVREEVYYENKDRIPYWECRNWVHPGWCGWQQVNVNEPSAEERLQYDLYYIKHRNLIWEMAIFVRYIIKLITGQGRTK